MNSMALGVKPLKWFSFICGATSPDLKVGENEGYFARGSGTCSTKSAGVLFALVVHIAAYTNLKPRGLKQSKECMKRREERPEAK
jgi:hypothetical protein